MNSAVGEAYADELVKLFQQQGMYETVMGHNYNFGVQCTLTFECSICSVSKPGSVIEHRSGLVG